MNRRTSHTLRSPGLVWGGRRETQRGIFSSPAPFSYRAAGIRGLGGTGTFPIAPSERPLNRLRPRGRARTPTLRQKEGPCWGNSRACSFSFDPLARRGQAGFKGLPTRVRKDWPRRRCSRRGPRFHLRPRGQRLVVGTTRTPPTSRENDASTGAGSRSRPRPSEGQGALSFPTSGCAVRRRRAAGLQGAQGRLNVLSLSLPLVCLVVFLPA